MVHVSKKGHNGGQECMFSRCQFADHLLCQCLSLDHYEMTVLDYLNCDYVVESNNRYINLLKKKEKETKKAPMEMEVEV